MNDQIPLTPLSAELEVLNAAASNPDGIASMPIVAPNPIHQGAMERLVKASHMTLIDLTMVQVGRNAAFAKVFRITMAGRKRLMDLRVGAS